MFLYHVCYIDSIYSSILLPKDSILSYFLLSNENWYPSVSHWRGHILFTGPLLYVLVGDWVKPPVTGGSTLLGTTKNFRPNARDPPRTRLNNTTSQFSLPSTGDPCIIHKNKNGPVESECKLNNVNPHIIRNQYQNQIEVTLNEDKYCKSCHYQTNTEF